MKSFVQRWYIKIASIAILCGLIGAVAFSQLPIAHAVDEWQPDHAYAVGEIVTYEGQTYRCIQAHTSLANWMPSAVPALWQLTTNQPPATTGITPGPTVGITPPPTEPPPTDQINVTYFQQWSIYTRNYFVKNIDTSGSANKLTAINYAFSAMSTDLKCSSFDMWADWQRTFTADQSVSGSADTWDQPLAGNFNQLKQLKAKYPHLKLFISLGGWTLSKNMSDAALPQNRAAYVQSCIDMYIKGNLPGLAPGAAAGIFDGIDVDWEYPAFPGETGNVYRPEDTQNFTALLAEFRQQLNALEGQTGEEYFLTIAAPSGQDKFEKIELGNIHSYLDWINLMTYDMHGAWDATGPTNHAAPLYCDPADPSPAPSNAYCIDNTVEAYLAAGIPAGKLTIGIPFYGRGWANVPNTNNGLFQSSPGMGPAPGLYPDAPGVNDYKVLVNLGYPEFRSSVTQSYWIFNGSTFWSFDDATAITAKVDYLKSKGLGGVMSWAIDGDDGTLMNTIYTALQND